MFVDIVLVFLLILLNGFFVAAEFAIVKVRETQLSASVSMGSKRTKLALSIIGNLNEYLSACQVGITLASLGLGWIAEPVFEHLFSPVFFWIGITDHLSIKALSAGFGFTFITYLHITLGEVAPKAVSIQYPKQTTLIISLPLKIFNTVFRPFIFLINGSSNLLLRMIGMTPTIEGGHHSEEELRMLLREGKRTGVIDDTEQQMIENVFDFADTSVSEILVPRTQMFTLSAETPIDEAIKIIVQEGYSRIPVYEFNQDNIIGILTSKDLLRMIAEGKSKTIRELLRPAHFVVKSKAVSALLREMQKKHLEIALVLNEYGGLEGMVTTEDMLEEIVGEIQDEHDHESSNVHRLNEQTFIVQAVASIEECNDTMHIRIPDSPQYTTIGGFALTLFNKIPLKGEKTHFEDLEFRAEQVAKNKIVTLRVTKK